MSAPVTLIHVVQLQKFGEWRVRLACGVMPDCQHHLQVSHKLLACMPDSLLNAQGEHTIFTAQFEDEQLTIFHRELLRTMHTRPQRRTRVG